MKHVTLALAALILTTAAPAPGATPAAVPARAPVEAFQLRLVTAMTKHLNLLLREDGSVIELKGKAADAETALAFYRMFEITGDPRYRKAALALADRILGEMRATKYGVLPIKEKEKEGGAKFIGGGPPALGFYTGNIAWILDKEGGRAADLKYLGQVIDDFPWNENGWWSQDINVATGEPKVPMEKPSIINKCTAMAMAAGMLAEALREIAPDLAARLKHKAGQCVYGQILPAQEADGFWHYNITGRDPNDKDILGYFMLTTRTLMGLQHFNATFREPKLTAAIAKAQKFALECIAPMTDPNTGPPCAAHTTPGTPRHYRLAEESKRGFELAELLIGGGHTDEGIKIMDESLKHLRLGEAGMDGARAAAHATAILMHFKVRNR